MQHNPIRWPILSTTKLEKSEEYATIICHWHTKPVSFLMKKRKRKLRSAPIGLQLAR